MLARSVFRMAKQVSAPVKMINTSFAVRSMGGSGHGHAAKPASNDVVIPVVEETLEWLLDSPPNVHQFEEPPIVVEIEHLKALPVIDVDGH